MAALTPMAMGGIPAAAAHSPATHAAPGKGKSVSLQHSAATAGAAHPGRVDLSACTASIKTTRPVNSLIQHFNVWVKPETHGVCIGTTSVQRHFLNNNCVFIHFWVSYGNSQVSFKNLLSRCGTAGQTKTFESGFRHIFPHLTGKPYVKVCVSSSFTTSFCAAFSAPA